MTRSPLLEARDLAFAYRPEQPVLHQAALQVNEGHFVCILGPNGSGKTTLLRCILRQITPSAGVIHLSGRDLASYSPRELARTLAYVPQFPRSAFNFTVQELVLMGRFAHTGALGLAGQQDRAVAHLAMEMTGTLPFASRTLEELSGGEAQCVMIARALAQQPSLTLLDEPTSHLDIKNQLLIYRMMRRLAHDWNMGVLCVSHDLNLAARFADDLVLLRKGEMVCAGPPAQVIESDLLSQTYDVTIELIKLPGEEIPIIWAR
jgi:ABC-type cobalamin/Fe3+-siderophores transport system ATPase subunit